MRTAYRVVATVVAVLLLAGAARAQTATGQILGTVKDASGGIMPKVKVVVTNTQTGLTRETTTADNGTYVVPLLPAGAYVVTAEQTGFKLGVLSDIQLNVDQVQRVDFQLEAGNISERVEVIGQLVHHRHPVGVGRPRHYRTAGHRPAAQRPQLSPAVVPGRRSG